MTIDQTIDHLFGIMSHWVQSIVFWGPQIGGADVPLVVLWLAAGAIFFTVYLNFANIRFFGHAIKCLGNTYDEPGAKGQTSNFESLSACLSATIGLGNIAGVAVAITVGGPGAAFWMVLLGFFGMGSKCAEVMMGHKYRQFPDPERPDEVAGGPMYYLQHAFATRNLPRVGAVVAALFAVFCIGGALGGGNMFQSNQMYQQLVYASGGEQSFFQDKGWLFGLILAVLTGLVTLGGINSIASVASKLTPIMVIFYMLCGLCVLGVQHEHLLPALKTIVTSAFSWDAGLGGFIGAVVAGVKRAAFSNEAGLGTAAIIQASAKTEFPARQALVGGLGPFFDTVVVCLMTALVIVTSGVYQGQQGVGGIELTSRAFETVFPWFDLALVVCVALFAYSTIIVYSYYGEKCVGYLFGDHRATAIAFRVVYLVFVVIGSCASLSNVIDFSEATFLAMAVPNILGLYFLAPEIRRDMKQYLTDMKLYPKS